MQQMEYSRGYLFHRSPREVPQCRELYHNSEKSLTIRGIVEKAIGYFTAAVGCERSDTPFTLNRCIALHEVENSKVADLS